MATLRYSHGHVPACAGVKDREKEDAVKDWIDPDARNPLYKRSMPLSEAIPNMRCVVIDLEFGYAEARTLASAYRRERDVTRWRKVVECLVAKDTKGNIIDLCLDGIHYHPDGNWSKARFTIRATDEEIAALYEWLQAENHTKAAESLLSLYPNLALKLGDKFWEDVDHLLKTGN